MTKAQALKKATSTQKALNTVEQKAAVAALDRDRAIYQAQQAGASYADLQEATGLSDTRVTQILRRARQSL